MDNLLLLEKRRHLQHSINPVRYWSKLVRVGKDCAAGRHITEAQTGKNKLQQLRGKKAAVPDWYKCSDSDTQERVSSPLNSEETDSGLGLEGSDLSEYLRVRAEIDDIDAAFVTVGNHGVLVPLSSCTESPSVASSSSSFDSSAAPV
ncbi:hypothetical protein FCM35_KLT01920 [Carex littledalei]|uniref:Uncharacterized protein n=1 Tax=Carex littledalei TaxID=544730 RepID=A0A833R2M7_9POAL|nr:hypothetical protein FCM35_KLT01920 [Carex littledalei]